MFPKQYSWQESFQRNLPISELFPESSLGFSAVAACQDQLWSLEKGPDPYRTTHTWPSAGEEHRSVLGATGHTHWIQPQNWSTVSISLETLEPQAMLRKVQGGGGRCGRGSWESKSTFREAGSSVRVLTETRGWRWLVEGAPSQARAGGRGLLETAPWGEGGAWGPGSGVLVTGRREV